MKNISYYSAVELCHLWKEFIFCLIIYFRQQKEEKAARLEELKKNAPSDDIFDQLPDTFESEQPELEPEETEVPTRTEFFEGDEEEEVCFSFWSLFFIVVLGMIFFSLA